TPAAVGKPNYMASETWYDKLSMHSDQYSLAVTYVELRTGRSPFAAGSVIQIMKAHINDRPDIDDLPEPEREVLLRALAKNPKERFPDCMAFAEALSKAAQKCDATLRPAKSSGTPGSKPTRSSVKATSHGEATTTDSQ